MHIGYLITNLGSPDSPSVPDVRTYLAEFLMDPYVVDLPWILRRLIVSGIILPFRPRKSAHAYDSIWTSDGSPLLVHSREFAHHLSQELTAPVALGMRYGKPSLHDAITQLLEKGVQHIIAAPLYPQFADSTVTTTINEIKRLLPSDIGCEFLPAFYDQPAYLDALAANVRANLPEPCDLVLMSYHGLPERQLRKADPTGAHCMSSENCCAIASPAHQTCYRHQAYATSAALAERLGLGPDQYRVSFQSRLGRGWMQPFTDHVLQALPASGIKHVAVTCPAFVADNLETLEEIELQGRQIFLQAGGESFHLLPCLNSDPQWVAGFAGLLTELANVRQAEPASADTSS
jgi:ferrochelatase